ncbi:MAG: hypothetical protein ACO3XO_01035 [Bdellovibrionota bacterium]
MLKIPSKWSDGTVAYHSLAYGMAEGFVQAFYLFEATQQLEIENLHEEGDRMSVSKFTLSGSVFENSRVKSLRAFETLILPYEETTSPHSPSRLHQVRRRGSTASSASKWSYERLPRVKALETGQYYR